MVRPTLQVNTLVLLVAAPVGVLPQSVGGSCDGVVADLAWAPDISGTPGSSESSWRACQAKCSIIPACAHFTYLPYGLCHFQDAAAQSSLVVGVVSGPPFCNAPLRRAVATESSPRATLAKRLSNYSENDWDGCVGVVRGVSWHPRLLDQAVTREHDWKACQARCQRTPDCAHFTFDIGEQCHLQGADALYTLNEGAISGGRSCGSQRIGHRGADLTEGMLPKPQPNRTRWWEGCIGVEADAIWKPDIPHSHSSVRTGWRECQVKCQIHRGCVHFTFFFGGDCHLQDIHATKYYARATIAGSPICGEVFIGPKTTFQPRTPGALADVALALPALPETTPKPQDHDEPRKKDNHFISLIPWLVGALVLIAIGAIGAMWYFGHLPCSENKEEEEEEREEHRKKKHHSRLVEPLRQDIVYPQQSIDWFPNIREHPSLFDGRSPHGLQPGSESRESAGQGAFGGFGSMEFPAVPSSNGPHSLAHDLRIGDVVDVFSEKGQMWYECRVERIEPNRLTVVHGLLRRRIDLSSPDLERTIRIPQPHLGHRPLEPDLPHGPPAKTHFVVL